MVSQQKYPIKTGVKFYPQLPFYKFNPGGWLFGNRFIQGWMKCTKLLSKPSTDFWGSVKCTKFVMDEMYEMDQFLSELQYECSRICVVSVVRAQTLC